MHADFRKLLDAVAVRAGWKTGEVRATEAPSPVD